MKKQCRSIRYQRISQLPNTVTIFLWACFGILIVSGSVGVSFKTDQSLWTTPFARAAVTNQFTPGTVTTYPTIKSAGIELAFTNDANANASVGLAYRVVGASSWQTGQSLVRIRVSTADSFAGSLFFLQPATTYEYQLTFTDPDGSTIPSTTGTVTMLANAPVEPNTRSLYVSTTGNDTNPGTSSNQSFRTIQHAADVSLPGDAITVASGQYDENVLITRSGTAAAPILFKSQETATTPGSNPAKVYAHVPRLAVIDSNDDWHPSGNPEVYYTDMTEWSNLIGNPNASDNPGYVAVDDDQLYSYWYFPYNSEVTFQRFLDGIYCLGGVPANCLSTGIDGGYYYDYLGKRLFVRLPDGSDPDMHIMHVSKRDFYSITGSAAFRIRDASNIIVRGFEVGFAQVGLWMEGKVPSSVAKENVFEKNIVHHTKEGIGLGGAEGYHEDADTRVLQNLVQDNVIWNDNMREWLWDAIKNNQVESRGIFVLAGFGNTLRRNQIHDVFNGIEIASSDYLNSERYNANTDVAENTLWDLGDDAIEPEGSDINIRIWGNHVERRQAALMSAESGISTAPVEVGPVWALYNTFIDTRQTSFKHRGDNTAGWLMAYHNTIFNDEPDFMALHRQWGDWYAGGVKTKYRNNLFIAVGTEDNGPGGGFVLEDISTNPLGAPLMYDFDYDNLYSTRIINCGIVDPGCRFASWGGIRHSLAELQTATGFEPHGLSVDPLFVSAANGDSHLQANSPVIDQGVLLPGINQTYAGNGPDLGAYEYPTCTENWQCGAWSMCISSSQSRTCTDLNSCGTTVNRPPLTQSCDSTLPSVVIDLRAP